MEQPPETDVDRDKDQGYLYQNRIRELYHEIENLQKTIIELNKQARPLRERKKKCELAIRILLTKLNVGGIRIDDKAIICAKKQKREHETVTQKAEKVKEPKKGKKK